MPSNFSRTGASRNSSISTFQVCARPESTESAYPSVWSEPYRLLVSSPVPPLPASTTTQASSGMSAYPMILRRSRPASQDHTRHRGRPCCQAWTTRYTSAATIETSSEVRDFTAISTSAATPSEEYRCHSLRVWSAPIRMAAMMAVMPMKLGW